ncbi:MAG: hypothetical protein OHK0029_29550 [Armatimonadaceae bacterium]
MLNSVTRRRLLQAAGGITFLAISADGRVVQAASRRSAAPQPVFKALPYLQPGAAGGSLRDGSESLVLAWETTRIPARFEVEWGTGSRMSDGTVTPERTERYNFRKEDGKSAYHYAAVLTGLRLDSRYSYRVRMDGRTLIEGYFTTRKGRGKKCRFAAFGDNSLGDIHERMIAYQTYRAKPDFLLNTGDNVYENGLANEYTRYFFPIFNADTASPRSGAPLLRSLLFYTVLANHDYNTSNEKGPVSDFERDPDCLGYFQCLHLPENGDTAPTHPMPIAGPEEQLAIFLKAAGTRYPRMGTYSFDYGDGHFLCLDSNTYVDPTDRRLQEWIERDLAGTDASWKFVVYHHPAFGAGEVHYRQQHMRVLSPLFEKHGVDIVLHGHAHTYQRTRPFRFTPTDVARARAVGSGDRLVPGQFSVDTRYDGERNTRADGVVYITTGAAGKYLYDPEATDNPAKWRHPEDNNVDYVVRFVSDRHSLTLFDMDAETLTLRQVDQWGETIDRCRFTKK